ncbi:MAG: hypothetical protein WBH31_01130 [Promethearchaeia archaeon]
MKKRNVGFILFGVAGANLITSTITFLIYSQRYEHVPQLRIIYELTYKISFIPAFILVCAGVIVLIKFRKEKEIRKINKSDIGEEIYNFLKGNVNQAFTVKSIINRVFSEGISEVTEDLVEDSLENLVQNDKIQKTLKDNELFYHFQIN